MEFYYEEENSVTNCVDRFNSQRDGILRDPSTRLPGKNQVSIPNGMEFYFCFVAAINPLKRGFNSQRDGILPKSSKFSFISSRFNSQRDGILPK